MWVVKMAVGETDHFGIIKDYDVKITSPLETILMGEKDHKDA